MFVLNDPNSLNLDPTGIVNDKYLTVQAARRLTGYNSQYLRRLLRNGRLSGIRAGQTWLILLDSLEAYLSQAEKRGDQRCGPDSNDRL